MNTEIIALLIIGLLMISFSWCLWSYEEVRRYRRESREYRKKYWDSHKLINEQSDYIDFLKTVIDEYVSDNNELKELTNDLRTELDNAYERIQQLGENHDND